MSKALCIDRLRFLVTDADDTLWYDARYFRALERVVVQRAAEHGWSEVDTIERVKRIAAAQVAGERGYARAVTEATLSLGLSASCRGAIQDAVHAFLDHPVEILPHVQDALMALQATYRCFVITKGNRDEQRRKLVSFGLGDLFEEYIVLDRKTVAYWEAAFRQRGITPCEAVVVGNSIKNDISPAIELGAAAIWLNHDENRFGRDGVLPPSACECAGWDEVLCSLSRVG